jgi:hypothetical protein
VVHHSAKAVGIRHAAGKRSAATAGALAALAVIVGCGGGPNTQPQVQAGPNVGAPINLADCTDWNRATVEQRLGTIKQLKDFAGGPVVGGTPNAPSGTGAVLDDKQAYDLFNNYCKESFARGFKLYKLYERAAAFAGHHQ